MPFIVALCKQEQCLAFSRNDHRRCRLRRLYGQKTCSVHRNYYENWFSNHQPWYRIGWLSDREREEYKFQLSGGHLTIPEHHVRALQPTLGDYYRFLVQYANIPVQWNVNCLSDAILMSMRRLFQEVDGAEKEFAVFLNTPEDCLTVLQNMISAWVRIILQLRQEIGTWISYSKAYDHLCFIIQSSEGWRQLIFSTDMEKLVSTRASILHVAGSVLDTIDTLYLKPLQKDFLLMFKVHCKAGIRQRMNMLKEELMMVTWHPTKVAAMLEAGDDLWEH